MDDWIRINNARVDFSDAARILRDMADDVRSLSDIHSGPLAQALNRLEREWRRTVKKSTWYHPVPASDNSIIAYRKMRGGVLTFIFGWYAFKGTREAARKRLRLRLEGHNGMPGFLEVARHVLEEVL